MMTGNVRIRKDGESRTGKSTTKKSGIQMNGENEKPHSCENTLPVGAAAILLLCPIIQTSKCTADPNISILKIRRPSATIVMEGFTEEDLRVLVAQRLQLSWRVTRATDALLTAINNALQKDIVIGTNPGTKPTEKRTGAVTPKKKSIPKPESGWKCVYPDDCMVKNDLEPPCPVNCGECISLRKP